MSWVFLSSFISAGISTHILESIAETNTDIIDLDWQVDMDEARRILGNNVVIGGNLNPVLVQDKTAARYTKCPKR